MRLRHTLFGLFFALMSAYAAANAYHQLRVFAPLGERGWYARESGGRLFVEEVLSGGPAVALRPGDEVVALDGEGVNRPYQIWRHIARKPPGADYTVAIRRGGEPSELTLRSGPLPASRWAVMILVYALIPAVNLLLALAVFLLKPGDKQALLLAVVCVLVVGILYPPVLLPWWLPVVTVAGFLAASFSPAAFLHFFLIFPEPAPPLRRFPRLERWLYAPFLVTVFPVVATFCYLMSVDEGRGIAFYADFSLLSLFRLYSLAYVTAGLLALAANYRRAGEVARRRMRVMMAGTLAGSLPLVSLVVADLLGLLPYGQDITNWLFAAGYAAMLLMPVAFVYAIARHQIIPVSLIVRRSVQYLLAKNALRLLLALPIAGLAAAVIANPDRTLSDILLRSSFHFYLLALAAVALTLAYRRRLGEWVDRKFFREQYDQEKVLRALVEDVKRVDSISEMSRRVSAEIERALHPERLYLFYRDARRGDLSLAYTSAGDGAAALRVPEEFRLLRFMEDTGGAQDFPFPRKNNLPQGEKDWLASLGARLVVPLTGTDERLAGLLLLGGKKSEVPYTARDRELLEAVAAQVALVYENIRLKERTREEARVRREVLTRFEEQNLRLLKECPRCGLCFDGASEACERDGAELQLSLPVERTVEGRYRLERVLGKGGMGAVYEATHLKLGHRVAVKILSGQMFGDAVALRRFEREARSLARLSQHANIVAVHDYGELQTGGAFLVMDLIAGETLGALLRRERRLAPARAAEIFEQVFEALKAAHSAGVVHRDLKPDNVFLSAPRDAGGSAAPHVRLLDFGLAKLTHAEGADSQAPTAARDPVTTPGAVMGTFGYMSPEQLTGGRVDERSDLFSAGVMICEALTGARPFGGATLHELIANVLGGEFRMTDGDAGVDPRVARLEAALRRCLARDPAARFPSAAAAQAEIIPALRDCPPHAFRPAEVETAILET